MKSSVDKLDGLARKLNIEVPADQVRDAFDRVYKGIQKNATIKGFRKGKAPLTAIRSMYGDRVKQDVLQDLVSENYQSALQEHSLDPVGFPKINFVEAIEEDSAFSFTAELEVRPEVSVQKAEGLTIQKEKLNIEDSQIDQVLENIRQSQAETGPMLEDRSLADGDIAEIDFEGFMNGQPLQGGSAEGHLLEIGGGQFIPGFEEKLIGMKSGDKRTVEIAFPEEYHAQELAGQPVTFNVTLKGIKRRILPELNDALAAKVGEFKTLDELKNAIREDIERSEQRRIQDDLRNRTLKALVEANPVDVPQALFEQQRQMIVNDVQQRMTQQGMGPDQWAQYQEQWKDEFDNSARFMVQSAFLIDALADQHNLRATAQELTQKIDEYAAQSGLEVARVKEFYKDSERRSRLAFQVTEEKVVGWLLEKADVQEVPADQLPQES